jgi:membrane protease YdiL (CAAX protease family)
MTVPVQARVAGRGRAAGPAVTTTLAGLAFLLARPGLEGLPPGGRTGVLAAGYLALGLAGAAVPSGRTAVPPGRTAVPPGRTAVPRAIRVRAGAVLAVGLAAVGAAALLAGPVPPLPGGLDALALGVLAAAAEEALFRGALYGVLERWGPVLAVGCSALLFALVHIPSYGLTALPVDFGAGLLFGWQRWASGRWTVPAATHATANLLAVILR